MTGNVDWMQSGFTLSQNSIPDMIYGIRGTIIQKIVLVEIKAHNSQRIK